MFVQVRAVMVASGWGKEGVVPCCAAMAPAVPGAGWVGWVVLRGVVGHDPKLYTCIMWRCRLFSQIG
ncbi:hypothetical protein GCM10010218_63840 [Streptomyces mashuensis]|uniref:Uncharacterized protein n=1 Tax=Streptomyces mashuensis TaxID=33904 RepID=A0A919BA22_9ACTN|nr:hypothetical protein GCM10010218_63840 [Streptomyces mashuensis]